MAVSFNLPDPYEAQKADIARRQKYAEALQQQAFQPVEIQSYQGIQAPIPVAAGLAKSKGEARRLIQGGGVRYDAGDGKAAIGVDAVLSGPGVLWKGKKDPVRLTPA